VIFLYRKILVPHDGSETSDKALSHAPYLSKISGAEVVVLNVIEDEIIPPSALLAFIRLETPLEKAKQDLRNTLEGGVKQMLERRIRECKEAGINKVSSEIRTGKPVDETVHLSEEIDCDIVVMSKK
jgi:nucleotide-binding universal stress UspA family protein